MKVGIVFPYYAHYRASIINNLSNDKENDFYFLGGVNVGPQFKGMKLMDFSSHPKFVALKNIWFLKFFSIQPNLKKEIVNGKYDCVIVFGDWKYLSTWRIPILLKKQNIPVLFWSHGFRVNKFSLNDFLKTMYFNLFDGGFVFDNRAKDIFIKKNYSKNIDVIFNSLDYENQSNVLNKISKNLEYMSFFQKQKPYVVFSGRLTHTKKLHLILEAIKQLKDRSVYIKVIFIGEGEYKESLNKLNRLLTIEDQIVFYGSCYDEKILASCFANAIACVVPSAVGLSAIHSLTYGCPVITDDNYPKHGPEVEAIIENKTGKYYRFDNVEDLSNMMQYFLNLSKADREFYRSNSIEIISNKYTANNQKTIINNRINIITSNKQNE